MGDRIKSESPTGSPRNAHAEAQRAFQEKRHIGKIVLIPPS